jgi:4-amino-4-deoxy-L-arabinose transferase-like glycosyltransferase
LKRWGASFGLVIALVVVLAFILRLWFALTLPTSSLPDEESHFNYVTFIARNWRPSTNYVFSQPTYYFAAALVYNLVSYFGTGFGFYSLRVLSVFLSVAVIIVGYKAIQAMTGDRITLLSSVLLMAFTPKVVLVSVGINNDQLSWLFSAFAIYYVIRSMNGEPKLLRMGIWTGLAVLTKLLTIPFVVGALAASLLGGGYTSTIKQSGLRALKYLVVVSIMTSWLFVWSTYSFGAPIPVAPWYVENKPYQFFLPNLASLRSLLLQATPADVRYNWDLILHPNILWGNLAMLFSFWLDSRTIPSWPAGITDWLLFWATIVFLPTLIILLGVFGTIKKKGAASSNERRISLVFLLVLVLFFGELDLFSYVVWQNANGRHLYSALPIIAFFFGSGVSFLRLKIRRFHLISKMIETTLGR